jgi:hypothetical protein
MHMLTMSSQVLLLLLSCEQYYQMPDTNLQAAALLGGASAVEVQWRGGGAVWEAVCCPHLSLQLLLLRLGTWLDTSAHARSPWAWTAMRSNSSSCRAMRRGGEWCVCVGGGGWGGVGQ